LGISRHFEKIIDIHALDFVNKPHPQAYEIVLDALSAQPRECVFADDTLQNLIPARAMGMLTVLVGESDGAGAVDHQIRFITALEAELGLRSRGC
jgi:putative hydrolase of the HAD superfamily